MCFLCLVIPRFKKCAELNATCNELFAYNSHVEQNQFPMPEGKRMRQPPKQSAFNQSSLTIPFAWMSLALIITNYEKVPWLGTFEQSHLSTFRKT